MRAFFVIGWTMILKVVSGSSNNVQEIWPGDFAHNQALAEIMNVGSSTQKYYKSRRIKRWTSLNKREVHNDTYWMVKYITKFL